MKIKHIVKTKKTKTLNVTVQCLAVYNSTIEVPADMSFEDAIKYAEQHLSKIPLGDLEYVPDSDELDVDNCDFAEDEDSN